MWGVAGAQAASMVACTAAVAYPVLAFVAGRYAAMGIPADLKHADGGVYTGQWSRAGKHGLGTYWYDMTAVLSFIELNQIPARQVLAF